MQQSQPLKLHKNILITLLIGIMMLCMIPVFANKAQAALSVVVVNYYNSSQLISTKTYQTTTAGKAISTQVFDTAPKKTGYEAGWATSKSATKIGYPSGTTVPADFIKNNASKGLVNLYAVWVPNTYTIKFHANGGSGTMADLSMKYDTASKLTANTYAKTGYTFAGWNTKKDGSGTAYSNKQSVKNLSSKANGSVTLYAQWTANTYTVVFDANNGTGQTKMQTLTYGVEKALTKNTFSKTGYSFDGWTTKSNGNGSWYGNKEIIENLTSKPNGTITLYAKWLPNKYEIRYYRHDGSGEYVSDYGYYDEAYVIADSLFNRDDYKFLSWNTQKDGSGTAYYPGNAALNLETQNGGIVKLYAQWAKKLYRYRKYETIATESSELPGWEEYYAEAVKGEWSEQKVAYNEEPTGNSNLEVDIVNTVTDTYTQYQYTRFGENGSPYSTDGSPQDIVLDERLLATVDAEYPNVTAYLDGRGTYWFHEAPISHETVEYYYRTRTVSMMHYFGRWSEWSSWSDVPIAAQDSRMEVEVKYGQ